MYFAESSLSFCAGTVWVSIADEKIYLCINCMHSWSGKSVYCAWSM